MAQQRRLERGDLSRIAIAAVIGAVLGAAGAWLESITGTSWVAVLLLPVSLLLDVLVETGIGMLGRRNRKTQTLATVVLVACYLGCWMALRG